MKSLSIAPMMGYTDRHFRYLMRSMTRNTVLYTEMLTCQALLHGDKTDLLGFDPIEKPLVLQLAGSDPKSLALCSRIAEDFGYDEVNLNIGCPSDRAQAGNFGVCLMKKPELVAECYEAMSLACNIPISIKHRIGIGTELSLESFYNNLCHFISKLAEVGCFNYIIHARSAILSSLSPRKNREIPPLRYDYVYKLARDFPKLNFILNGGIDSLASAIHLLEKEDEVLGGIMIGRAAYNRPGLFSRADTQFYGKSISSEKSGRYEDLGLFLDFETALPIDYSAIISFRDILDYLQSYFDKWQHKKDWGKILQHSLNVFKGLPNARKLRQSLGSLITSSDLPRNVFTKLAKEIPLEFIDNKIV